MHITGFLDFWGVSSEEGEAIWSSLHLRDVSWWEKRPVLYCWVTSKEGSMGWGGWSCGLLPQSCGCCRTVSQGLTPWALRVKSRLAAGLGTMLTCAVWCAVHGSMWEMGSVATLVSTKFWENMFHPGCKLGVLRGLELRVTGATAYTRDEAWMTILR